MSEFRDNIDDEDDDRDVLVVNNNEDDTLVVGLARNHVYFGVNGPSDGEFTEVWLEANELIRIRDHLTFLIDTFVVEDPSSGVP